MRIRFSDDVDGRGGAGHDPVELRPAGAPDADRDDDVAAERDRGERERADDARGAREGGRREPVDDPRREQREAGRDPGRDEHEVRQHVRVRLLRLAVVLDRVRERRPGEPERGQQQHHRRGDADADGVEADLGRVRELDEEEAVAEVRRPEEERRRHEREAEAVHLAEEAAVELEAELLAPVAEEREVDDQRAGEVADDDAERALVERDDEERASRRS